MKYNFDMSNKRDIIENHLNLGGEDRQGNSIGINNLYLTKNGKPWIPIMGECHFARLNPEDWEREILKMKAGGITIIATYLFWIYHEEIEGQLDFTGNKDIRRFVMICKKHGIDVVLRIGPWAHGEVRNGGFPDWLLKKDFKIRCNDDKYLALVKSYYQAIEEQVRGLMFKDNGNIVVVQLENELVNDAQHLATLKEIAIEVGLIAPIYTVTGWNSIYGAQIPKFDVLPVFGGYPEAPWTNHTKKLNPSPNYFFMQIRNDTAIGTDLITKVSEDDDHEKMDYNLYPFATCELGGGICVTYHRRPIIKGDDVAAVSHIKLGCGNNLPGYYMYHGGTNEIGKLSTFNESKETGYPNDYPIRSYDFQAPIGEYGLIRPQYRLFKLQHLFLNDYMQHFAPMDSYVADNKITDNNNVKDLRYAMRMKDNSGFVFVNNYQRITKMNDFDNVQFEINFDNDKTLVFPKQGIKVMADAYFMMPFNLCLNNVNLEYSTTQPLCIKDNTYFFLKIDGVKSEYVIDGDNIAEVSIGYQKDGKNIVISDVLAGKDNIIKITKKDGEYINIVTLTKNEALHLYKIDNEVIISNGDAYLAEDELTLYSIETNDLSYSIFDGDKFIEHKLIADEIKSSVEVSKLDNIDFESEHMKELFIGGDRGTKQWTINLSEIKNVDKKQYLHINYVGDVAQIYVNGQLVADEYYCGNPWLIDTKCLLEKGDSAVLVVTPIDSQDIYFETDKNSGAELFNIEVVTEYCEKVKL